MIRLPVCLVLFFAGSVFTDVFASESKPNSEFYVKASPGEKISKIPRSFRYQAVDRRKASQRKLSQSIDLRVSELARIAQLPYRFTPSELGLALDMDRVLISGDQSRFILLTASRRISDSDQNKLFRLSEGVLWHIRMDESDVALLLVGFTDAEVIEMKRQMDGAYLAEAERSKTARMPASEVVSVGSSVSIPGHVGPAAPAAIPEAPTYLSDLIDVARGCQVGLPAGMKDVLIGPGVTARLVESNVKAGLGDPMQYWRNSVSDFKLALKLLGEFEAALAKSYAEFKVRDVPNRFRESIKKLGAHDSSIKVAADAEFNCRLIPGAFTLAAGSAGSKLAETASTKLNQVAIRAAERAAQRDANSAIAVAARVRANERSMQREATPSVDLGGARDLPEVSVIEPKDRTVFRSNQLAADQADQRKLQAMSPSARVVQSKREELARAQAASNRISQSIPKKAQTAIPAEAVALKVKREALVVKQAQNSENTVAVGIAEHLDTDEALAMFYQMSDPKFPQKGFALTAAERASLEAEKFSGGSVVHAWSPTMRGSEAVVEVPRATADRGLRMPVQMMSSQEKAALSGAPGGTVVHAYSPSTRETEVLGAAAAPADKALLMKAESLLPVEKTALAGEMSGTVITSRPPDLSQMRMPVSEMSPDEKLRLAADLADQSKRPTLLHRTPDLTALKMPVETMTPVEIEKVVGEMQPSAIRSGNRDRSLQHAQTLVRESRRRFESRNKPESDYVPNSTRVEIEAEPAY